jgi:L-lactate dehydrogenase complex protein LldG
VLDRIRGALGPQPSVPEVPRAYRRSGDGGLDLFCERVADYVAKVHRVAEPDLDAALAGAVNGRVIAAPGLARRGTTTDGPHVTAAELDGFDAALTGCALAIAETGTIVLDGGPTSGRRALTLVPDHHLCVVRAEQIVASVPEAIEALAEAAREGRPITFVSGPSATSDIELERVEGVHGPRKLDVFVVAA